MERETGEREREIFENSWIEARWGMVSKTPFLGEDREGGGGGEERGDKIFDGEVGGEPGRSYIAYEASSGPIRGELDQGFSLFVHVTPFCYPLASGHRPSPFALVILDKGEHRGSLS